MLSGQDLIQVLVFYPVSSQHQSPAARTVPEHCAWLRTLLQVDQFELLAASQKQQQEAGPSSTSPQGTTAGVPPGTCLGPAAALGNSYLLNLAKLGGGLHAASGRSGADSSAGGGSSSTAVAGGAAGIRDVRDVVLLNGYMEPVLLVLHEPEPTWPGRYRCAVHGNTVVCNSVMAGNKRRHCWG